MADFFRMLAFNNATAGADCFFPGASETIPLSLRSCESTGKYMETGRSDGGACFEWAAPIFVKVGDQWDWTKMYWDLFADETGLGASRLRDYLLEEEAITGWNVVNHMDKILAITNGTPMNAAIRRAAVGNLWSGASH